MARPSKPIKDRILARSIRDGEHLFWQGAKRDHLPFLTHYGNPVRFLLNIPVRKHAKEFQLLQVKSICPHLMCIEPTHWRVVPTKPVAYDDAPLCEWVDPRGSPSGFSALDEEDLDDAVAGFKSGEYDLDHVLASLPSRLIEEFHRRSGK